MIEKQLALAEFEQWVSAPLIECVKYHLLDNESRFDCGMLLGHGVTTRNGRGK